MPAYELARRYGFAYGSPPVFGADRWIVPLSGSEYATAVTGKRAIIIPRGRNSFIQLEDQVTDFEIIDDGGYENPAQIDLNRAYRQSQSSGKNEIEPCTEMLRVLGKSLSNCKVYIKFSDEFGLESGITFVFSKTAHPSGLRGKSYRYDGFNECGADMYPVGGNGEILDLSKFWDLPVQTLP